MNKPKIISSATELDRLRLIIHIDNKWSAREYASLFDTIERLYKYYSLYESSIKAYENKGDEFNWPTGFRNLPEPQMIINSFITNSREILVLPIDMPKSYMSIWSYGWTLQVDKIKYGSKGSIDLLGLGSVLVTIKELIQNYVPSKEKNADINLKLKDTELKQKEIEIKEQELVSKKIENLKALGLSTSEIQTLIGQEYYQLENIKKLGGTGKIIDVEIIKDNKN